MDLSYLQTFLMVADTLSFTQAADKLNVSKGLVSRHIQKLEQQLNAKLFHRTTRSMHFTEAGEALYLKARQIQLLAIEAEMRLKDMTQVVSGDLHVTAPLELGKALCRHVIPQFCRDYPDINLMLDCGHEKKHIELGDYDVALRADDTLPQDVVAKPLGIIRNVIVCSKQYLNKNSMPDRNNIHQCAFVLNSRERRWGAFELHCGEQMVSLSVSGHLHCNTYSGIGDLALQGLGLACLPFYQVEEQIHRGEFIHVLPQWSIRAQALNLLYAQRREMPQKLLRFNMAVKQWLLSNESYLIS
ncbi:LysR family transcriptional regulator [uncultured Shewanella sp.]|uniref:LysR family transcriptional regulator n=1 Tax=uncultured Shewanella sp. TaxID=173975 RepID=UPI002630C417|nr:LysR family transcriptional regulator [uncultured Shewanella sp.]